MISVQKLKYETKLYYPRKNRKVRARTKAHKLTRKTVLCAVFSECVIQNVLINRTENGNICITISRLLFPQDKF